MIRTAIQRRISTALVALGLAIFGALNIGTLTVDFLPSNLGTAQKAVAAVIAEAEWPAGSFVIVFPPLKRPTRSCGTAACGYSRPTA